METGILIEAASRLMAADVAHRNLSADDLFELVMERAEMYAQLALAINDAVIEAVEIEESAE